MFHLFQHPGRHLHLLLTSILFVFCGLTVQGQSPTITYSQSQNLTQAYGSSSLTVKVVFNGACAGTQIRVGFPAGVTYIPGSVIKTSGSSTLDIVENNISNLESPVFDLNGPLATGDELEFSVFRKTGCTSTIGGNFDSVYVNFTGGCTDASKISSVDPDVKSYNILTPSLIITPPAAINNARIGNTYTRTTTIHNGSDSPTDTLRFFIVYPHNGIANTVAGGAITVNSTGFLPDRIHEDTSFYTIYGATLFGGDHKLDNTESVTITESIRLLQCNATTIYGVGWGADPSNICQTATATSAVSMAAGAPVFNTLGGARSNYTGLCNPFTISVAIKNDGSGDSQAATMYNLSLLHGDRSSNILAGPYNIDTTLLRVSNLQLNGQPLSFTWRPGTTIMIINLEDLFSTDPDGAGGLADADGDGFFDDLPPGATLTLTMQLEPKPKACGATKNFYGSGVKITYNNMCGDRLSTDGQGNSVGNISLASYGGIATVPANVLNGTPFQFGAKVSYVNNSNSFRGTHTRYRWKIVLPAGFSVAPSPNAYYGVNPVTNFTVSGDTVIYTSSNNVMSDFFINLVYTCGSSGTKTFLYLLEEINDINTSCNMWGNLVCATINTDAKCGEVCPAGPNVYKPTVRRADGSLGWTNNSMTTRQSASNISAYDLSKALYLDTILVSGSMRQSDASGNLHLYLSLPKTTISPAGVNKLTPVAVTSTLYRGGTLLNTWTITTASLSASTTTLQVIDWNLTPGLPAGGLLAGDSVVSESKYIVTAANLALQDEQSGQDWYFYNLAGTTKTFCNKWVPEMYLVGTSLINGTNAFNTNGCNAVTLGSNTWNLARRFSGSGQYFASEFRPAFYIDSVVVDLPDAYYLNSVTYAISYVAANAALGTTSNTPIMPDYINGTKKTYINPGTWKIPNITITNLYGAGVRINVSPTCATEAVMTTNVKVYIRDYYYAYATGSTPTPAPAGLRYVLGSAAEITSGSGQSRNIVYSGSGAPNLTLQNATGEIQGISANQRWTVTLGNAGTSAAPYTWIAIPAHSGIHVTQVMDGAAVIAPVNYPGGKIYRLSTTGITPGNSKSYDILFNYNTCTKDSLLVLGGWNCSVFPDNPSEYACGLDSVYLKIDPLPSQVQLSVQRHPGNNNPISLCNTDSTVLIVNSVQAANLISPYIRFTPPAGITVPPAVQVEYPLGSGNYQLLPVLMIGSAYQVNLKAHTGIGANGMPGTSTANITAYPGGQDRQAKIKLDFNTTCEFISGVSFRFSVFGYHPCGNAATGNNTSITTNPLHISGATATGSAGFNLTVSATSLQCGVPVRLSSVVIPTSVGSVNTDTLIYTLPEGAVYAGNITPGFTATVHANTVKIPMPVSPAATAVSFGFDVVAGGVTCAGGSVISVAYKREITNLTCGASSCSAAGIVIAQANSPAFNTQKPELEITDAAYASETLTPGGSYTVDLTIVNHSTVTAMAGYIVEAFCTGDVTPFDAAVIPAVPAGGAVTANLSFALPGNLVCITGYGITYKISPMTAAGVTQCLCTETSYMPLVILPGRAMGLTVKQQGGDVLLNWQTAAEQYVKGYVIERSADGHAWQHMGWVPVTYSSAYNFTDQTPLPGKNYYRVVIVQYDDQKVYSDIKTIVLDIGAAVKIYPNPANNFITVEGMQTGTVVKLSAVNGALLQKVIAGSSGTRLNLASYAKGIYVISVVNRDGTENHYKILKE